MPSAVGKNLVYGRIRSLCRALALFVLIGLQSQVALAEADADAPVGKFVINLTSALDATAPVDFASVPIAPGQQVYRTTVDVDGRTWHRVRLGFFATQADATAALSELRDDYPDAWVSRASDRELGMFADTEPTTDSSTANSASSREPDGVEAARAESRDPLRNLVRRQDERRPDDQFRTYWFDRPLTIGGQYEVSPEHRDNFNLDSDDDRNLTRVNQEFRLEMLYEYSPYPA